MNEILESLEVPFETKSALQESFDKSVMLEALKIAEGKEELYEEYMFNQLTEMKSELEDTLDSYLTKVVEEFVEENSFEINESIKAEKYDAVLEGFNSLMIATGVEIAQIAEAKETLPSGSNLEGMNDRLMEENIALKESNALLLKTGLIQEHAEGMTSLEKNRFFKLAEMVEFDDARASKFVDTLDTLVNEVKITKNKFNKPSRIQESKMLNESAYTPTATHLF